MQKRNLFIIACVVIVLLVIVFFQHNNSYRFFSNKDAFRDTSHVIFTKHAKCRMDCRHINKREINEVITTGNVNYAKSGYGTKGDETFALEGYSDEHQHLRVVVAPESDGLVVITCIDLDKEWPCNCY